MSSPPLNQNIPAITPQEISLIQQSYIEGFDINELSHAIQQKIKQQLSIDRSIEQISIYIAQNLSNKRSNQQKQHKQIQNINVSLFKTFEEDQLKFQPIQMPKFKTTRKNPINFISNRKIPKKQSVQYHSNFTLQQRLDELQQINQQCTYTYDKYDRKNNRKMSIKQQNGISSNILWFYHQFFYSNYDKKYFQNNNFMKTIYDSIQYKSGSVTLKMHTNLMKSLPTPKIFNQQFINNEKNKLQDFRNICRQNNTKNLSKNNESTTDFPVHSIVLALHPMCGHLHTGSIMAYYKQNLYMVRFLKPQLPAQKILDINMSTQFTALSNKSLYNNNNNNINIQKNLNSQQQQNQTFEIIQHINYQITGYLIKILALKSQLVKLIRNINNKTDKKQNISPQRKDININKQIFQWAIFIINKLDIIIKQTLVRFRLRGVNQGNSSTIYGNIKNLLLNPLKLMSKQFQNSNQQPDINAAQQIRQIINKQRQSQIKKALNNAITISNNNNNNPNIHTNININIKSQLGIQQQNNKQNIKAQNKMINLIHYCLGILADLRYQGKGFDVQTNVNLIKLAQLCGQDNSQAFNQVFDRLYSIVNKVKE